MDTAVLQAHHLAKRYNNKTLFENVSITVHRGQAIAFVGPNGSGKTTLLKILANLVQPSQGAVVHDNGIRFGYIPEHFPKMNLTATQYIHHMGLIEGWDKGKVIRQSQALFSDFFLTGMTNVPIKYLSKGTMQKVGVVQALLTECDILLLDEPLSGQDYQSQQVFIQKITERKKAGAAVLLSCHEMPLVNRLADTVYEITDKALREMTLEDHHAEAYMSLIFSGGQEDYRMPRIPRECTVQKEQGIIRVAVPTHLSDALIIQLIQSGLSLKGIEHENGL